MPFSLFDWALYPLMPDNNDLSTSTPDGQPECQRFGLFVVAVRAEGFKAIEEAAPTALSDRQRVMSLPGWVIPPTALADASIALIDLTPDCADITLQDQEMGQRGITALIGGPSGSSSGQLHPTPTCTCAIGLVGIKLPNTEPSVVANPAHHPSSRLVFSRALCRVS